MARSSCGNRFCETIHVHFKKKYADMKKNLVNLQNHENTDIAMSLKLKHIFPNIKLFYSLNVRKKCFDYLMKSFWAKEDTYSKSIKICRWDSKTSTDFTAGGEDLVLFRALASHCCKLYKNLTLSISLRFAGHSNFASTLDATCIEISIYFLYRFSQLLTVNFSSPTVVSLCCARQSLPVVERRLAELQQ